MKRPTNTYNLSCVGRCAPDAPDGPQKDASDELSAFLQHTAANAGLWLYTQRGFGHYLRTHYGNDPVNNPFRYLYQWNAFDTTLLIPYFLVMIVLAFYGMHRYQLVYLYYKHRNRAVIEPPAISPNCPASRCSCPSTTSNTSSTVSSTPCCRLDYPADRLEIQVLDDSTDETAAGSQRAMVERYRALGHTIVYLHRTNRYGYKAGALDAGLKRATGDLIAIFDADFVPPQTG